jgi:hypothetical protein
LPAAAQLAADAQPERQHLRLEQAAMLVERQAGTQQHDPGPGVLGRAGGGLPYPADVGEEVGAGGRVLGYRAVAGVAVPTHRGRLQQDLGAVGLGQMRDGTRDGAGAVEPAGTDLALVAGGPALVADARPSQVHDGVGRGDRRRVELAGRRLPGHFAGVPRGPADEAGHVVALLAQPVGEAGAEEAGSTGHENPHAPIIPEFERAQNCV